MPANMRVFLPNLITCLNLFCGCLAIVFAFNEHLLYSTFLIGIAAVFDFLDGFVARLVKGQSELGKQLDSLADMVTFGMVPGVILFQMTTICLGNYGKDFSNISTGDLLLACCGFAVTIAAALRLAKFNIDTEQSSSFLGLPTPASTLLVATFPLMLEVHFNMNFYYPPIPEVMQAMAEKYHWGNFEHTVSGILFNPYFYVSIAVILGLLMVSRVPMFSLKVKNLKWKGNEIRYIFLLEVLILGLITAIPYLFSYWDVVRNFIFLEYLAIPIVLILYIITAVIHGTITKSKHEIYS